MTIAQRSNIRQRVLAILVAGIGAFAASAVSFAMAVYDAAYPQPLREIQVGENIDTGRWRVAVSGAHFAATPPTGVPPPEPTRYLTVELQLENLGAASAYASRNLFSIEPAVPNLEEPTIYLARDKWIASPLNPGMPEMMLATWEWPDAQGIPAEMTLVIGGQIFKRRDNLYGASGWFDRDPIASVSLPLEPTGAAP